MVHGCGGSAERDKTVRWGSVSLGGRRDGLAMKRALVLAVCSVAIALLLLVAITDAAPAEAAAAPECSEQETVFEDPSGRAYLRRSAIVVDASGVAHLFWLYQPDKDNPSDMSIMYAHWKDGDWSEANDVLRTPGGGLGWPRAVATSDGQIHIIWTAGGQRLWYSSAPAEQASDARSWRAPITIGYDPLGGDIATDKVGTLHVVYTTGQPTAPVYYIQSAGGTHWSDPVQVFGYAPEYAGSGGVRIAVDGRGRLHVVWDTATLPNGWPLLGEWYARSENGGASWSDALQLGSGEQGEGAVVAVGDDEIHIVWRGSSGAGKTYHQWSADGGASWWGPTVFDPDGGFSGPQNLVVDSAGDVHLVRSDGGYQWWDGLRWSPVPATFADSGEPAAAAVGLGNQLHYINSRMEGPGVSIWHRICLLESPAIPAVPLPEYERSVAPTPAGIEELASRATPDTVTASPIGAIDKEPPVSSLSQGLGPLLGILLTAALMIGIVVAQVLRQGRARG